MSSSRTIPLYAFINYLASGDRSHLPEKNTAFYKIEEFAKIEIPIDSRIKELKDFNFDMGIEFKGCHFPTTLRFNNCKGRGGIKFIDCTASEFDTKDPFPSLEFQNFTFDQMSFEGCIFPGGLFLDQFENKQEQANILSSLTISNSSFSQGGINLDNVKFKHGFEFSNIKDCGPIKIKNIETNAECKSIKVNAFSLKVSGDQLKVGGGLKINRSLIPNVFFEGGQIDGDLKFYEVRVQGQMSFSGASIKGSTLITTSPEVPQSKKKSPNFEPHIPSLFFHTTDFNEGFQLEGGGKVVNEVSINFSPLLKGRMLFRNSNIKKIKLTGTNSNNNLYFRNIGIGKLNLNDFLNLKSLSFSNLNSSFTQSQNSVFQVLDSDLGNWELANFDFDSFAKIIWRDSQITGLRTSAVSWFKDRKLEAEGENDPSTCFRRREFYRQLKQASEKQGDRINELEFKRREIKAYRKGLKIRKENRWDRFTIWTGGSNNHGQSWGKALGLIIALTLVIFYPLIISCADPELTFWPINSNWKGFGFFWDKYKQYSDSIPELFNPTRRTDILYKDPTNLGWLRFWDGLHRIILTFFIFQIVSAFRKFVK